MPHCQDASPVVCLEVLRGLTQFPRRPFPVGRFLIGSGTDCDLRLGGAEIPVLHSVLLVDSAGVTLEAVAGSPPLAVNGNTCQTTRLRYGDVIAIGGFEFAVQTPVAATPALPTAAGEAHEAGPHCDDELAMRSAIELVELIEGEVHRIEDYQSRRELGAKALLEAALRRARSAAYGDDLDDPTDVSAGNSGLVARSPLVDTSAPSHEAAIVPENFAENSLEGPLELDEIVARLDDFSAQLARRSRRLEENEAEYLQASSELLKAQQRLADHLELLQKQIAGLEATHSESLRASA
jgi:hypothetical protein